MLNVCLIYRKLFPETKAFMCTIQDQTINMNHQKFIIHQQNNHQIIDKRRHCYSVSEAVQHITGSYKTEYQLPFEIHTG